VNFTPGRATAPLPVSTPHTGTQIPVEWRDGHVPRALKVHLEVCQHLSMWEQAPLARIRPLLAGMQSAALSTSGRLHGH
jgi:hypothetical protein